MSKEESVQMWYEGFWASRDGRFDEAREKLRAAHRGLIAAEDYTQGAWVALDLILTYLQRQDLKGAREEFYTIDEGLIEKTWAYHTMQCLFKAFDAATNELHLQMLREVFFDMQLYVSNAALQHLPEYRLIFWRVMGGT